MKTNVYGSFGQKHHDESMQHEINNRSLYFAGYTVCAPDPLT